MLFCTISTPLGRQGSSIHHWPHESVYRLRQVWRCCHDTANNYTQEVIFCGGVQRPLNEWGNGRRSFVQPSQHSGEQGVRAHHTRSRQPNVAADDDLINGRSMGTFVYLPDGKLWFGQGVRMGTGGYSGQPYNKNIGISLGDQPDYQPMIYDPTAASGSRWSIAV